MSEREVVLLGTASRAPTRERSQHATVLRFDGELLLFDPGEGTQRQLLRAELGGARIHHVLITHFHGDHCLGLPGVLQRLSMDRPGHTVDVVFPRGGQADLDALRRLSPVDDQVEVREHPSDAGEVLTTSRLRVTAAPLDHPVPTIGYRLDEPSRRHLIPERLEDAGVRGPDIGRLERDGQIEVDGRRVTVEEVSEPRPGQSVAFVMDTRWCETAATLAADTDLMVCEATFLERHAELADRYGHLTVAQAVRLARKAGTRRLVLTHFSQRYADPDEITAEAVAHAGDEVDVAVGHDLLRVELPARR